MFEVKVGTRHFEIDILLLHRVKKNNFGVEGANFDLNYLSYFSINFQNSCVNTSVHTQENDKKTK